MLSLKSRFPVWQYLNQPLFQLAHPFILDPRRFWFHYRVELLERCLTQTHAKQQLD